MSASLLSADVLQGIPLPYSPHTDTGLTLLLLGCFFISAYVLSRNRRFLGELAHDFVFHRERASLFATSTAADVHCLVLLILQACVQSGICLFSYSIDLHPSLVADVPSYKLLGVYIGLCLLYFFSKWVLYSFLGWIFFDKTKVSLWMEAYFTLLYYWGLLLLPFALLIVYFDLSIFWTVIIGLFLFILVKVLILYKWIKLFCHNLGSGFLLILYFCALEIVPCLAFYRGVFQLNELFGKKILGL